MKTNLSTSIFQPLSQQQMQQLAAQAGGVQQQVTMHSQQPAIKTFGAVDLWNIQKNRKTKALYSRAAF